MKRSRILPILLLPLAAFFCLVAIIGFNSVLGIPEQATHIFGPPAADLGVIEKYYRPAILLWQADELTQPVDLDGDTIPFQVALGETPASVASRMVDLGLIQDSGAFGNYLVYAGLDTRIQAGDYALSPAMSALEIAQTLRDSTSAEVLFPLLAGWRLEEIAASLPTSGLSIDPDEFITLVQSQQSEGSLLPGTYQVLRTTSAEGLVNKLTGAFEEVITQEMEKGFNEQGLSIQDAVILASIIQREAVVEDEMPLIASVFLNRLAINMKLDADPTVQYALGYNPTQATWWKNPLAGSDLQFDSPYNTYLYPGLPPKPICSPGVNALRAVAFPAQTPYYYFRAACDGSGRHLFAESFDEHKDNACP